MSVSSILPVSFGAKAFRRDGGVFGIAERVIVDVFQPLEPALDGLHAAEVIDEVVHRLGEARHQRLEGDQASQRQRALDHAQAADAEDGRDRQSRSTASAAMSRKIEEAPSSCSAFNALAWMPAHWPKASSSRPLAFRVSMLRTALTVAPTSLPCSSARLRLRSSRRSADQLQRQHVRKRHADADHGERQIVDRHGGGEEDDRGQVERVGGDAARKQAADLLVGADAGGNIAGVTLGEEFDRQRHHMPEEAADHDDRKLGLQPQQQRLAHERQQPRAPARSGPCRSAAE